MVGLRHYLRGRTQGKPTAKTEVVKNATGPVYTISRLLGSSSTLSLVAGTNANLTLSGSVISATAPIAVGSSQIAVVRENLGQLAIEYPVTISRPSDVASLNPLTISPATATAGQATTILISGATAGSTITGVVPDGMVLDSTNRAISGVPTVSGTYNFTLTETLVGAPNSPKVSNVTVSVAQAEPSPEPTPSLLPVGMTYTWLGDGNTSSSGGVGAGTANMVHQFMRLAGVRVQPSPAHNLGTSGTTIGPEPFNGAPGWINPYGIDAMAAQVPDIMILGTFGANDNILSTDPGANANAGFTTNAQLTRWYNAIQYAYNKFNSYGGKLFVVIPTSSSMDSGEATYRTRVWDAQKAFVEGLAATDNRVIFIDISDMSDPTQWSVDSGNAYAHLDERAAYHIANKVWTALDARIVSKSVDELLDMIDAGNYPLAITGNLDSDTGLAGGTGTKTNIDTTSVVPTSKVVSNQSGATATGIIATKQTTTAGRSKIVINLSGTASATSNARIFIEDKVVSSYSTTPGQIVRAGAIFRAPANVFRNFGGGWGGSNIAHWGQGAPTIANQGFAGANETHEVSNAIILGNGLHTGNSTTISGKRTFGISFVTGQTLSGTIEFERPFAFKPSNRLATNMVYIGGTQTGAGAAAVPASFQMKPTGPVTNAAGGTIRVEPGMWNLFGLTEADFAERRIYVGGSSGGADDKQNLGTGTLLTTLTGSNWTYVVAAGALNTGSVIYVEITDRHGVAWRSSASLTVG